MYIHICMMYAHMYEELPDALPETHTPCTPEVLSKTSSFETLITTPQSESASSLDSSVATQVVMVSHLDNSLFACIAAHIDGDDWISQPRGSSGLAEEQDRDDFESEFASSTMGAFRDHIVQLYGESSTLAKNLQDEHYEVQPEEMHIVSAWLGRRIQVTVSMRTASGIEWEQQQTYGTDGSGNSALRLLLQLEGSEPEVTGRYALLAKVKPTAHCQSCSGPDPVDAPCAADRLSKWNVKHWGSFSHLADAPVPVTKVKAIQIKAHLSRTCTESHLEHSLFMCSPGVGRSVSRDGPPGSSPWGEPFGVMMRQAAWRPWMFH